MTKLHRPHAFRLFGFAALGLTLGSCLPVEALTINITYDSSVTSLSNAAEVETAVNYAVQRLQGLITDPVTVNVTVVAVSGTSDFGDSDPTLAPAYYTYSQIRTALTSHATSGNDKTAAASLSLTDPTKGGTFSVPTAEAKVLGLIGASSASDGTFYFGTGYDFTFDPNNRAVPGEYDFIGVAEHEITHVMGRVSALGKISEMGTPGIYPYDLYRYAAGGSRSLVWGNNNYFSINNGITNLQTYDSYSDPADWWSNAVGDAFIAETGPDVQNGITPVDMTVMDILGYTLNSATADPAITSSATANAQVGQNFSYTITASNGPISSYGVTSGLPSWLSVNQSTGVISGTPPTPGTYAMTIDAANAQEPATATLTITVASDAPFGGYAAGANGEYYSPWFGYYDNAYYPFIYRYDLGWIYVYTSDDANYYLYVFNGNGGASMGWIYTSQAFFPFVYDFTDNDFLYFFTGGTTFYNFGTGQYETY